MLSGKWTSRKSPYTPQPTELSKADDSTHLVTFVSEGVNGISSADSDQATLYNRMSAAITTIEKAYSPLMIFDGYFEVERLRLDQAELNSIDDIVRWENGWLALLRALSKTGVRA